MDSSLSLLYARVSLFLSQSNPFTSREYTLLGYSNIASNPWKERLEPPRASHNGVPIPPEEKDGIFTQMAQLFIDTYEELTAAMEVMKAVGIDPDNRKERIDDLQMRYTAIIEKYQSKIFELPIPLDDKQKHYIKLFIDEKCTDGYLMTQLKLSS